MSHPPFDVPATLANTYQFVYLIRHGETDYNVRNIVQGGGIDSDLNEKGLWQAERLYKAYRNTGFEWVYCSALKRTKQTVSHFIESGIPTCYDARLNEMGWGSLEGAEASATTRHVFESAITAWAQGDLNYRLSDGETPLQVANRCWASLMDIMQNHPNSLILVCTHGRVLRILLCLLLGYSIRQMQDFKHSNAAVNIVRRTGLKFTLDKVNDLSHV
jgi:broad specificity phosphatase PhoE